MAATWAHATVRLITPMPSVKSAMASPTASTMATTRSPVTHAAVSPSTLLSSTLANKQLIESYTLYKTTTCLINISILRYFYIGFITTLVSYY